MISRKSQVVLLVTLCALVLVRLGEAAQGQRGGRGTAPQSPREGAAVDLTGYWVSVITEDWKYRMVTPSRGVFDSLALNAEGRRVGNSWDPDRDEAAGEQCRAYGAANIMRLPGRVHVTWEDANTLRIDTDAGTQTRRVHFMAAVPAAEPSWQGSSIGQWEYGPSGRGNAKTGDLKVLTTNLRAGYVRKNGAPYSDKTSVTEYYDVNVMPNGDQWMTVTTKVEDPVYFSRPYLTTTDFKKLPNASGWNPTPCSAR